MKRFVNVRLPVLIACALALGVWAGYLFCFNHLDLIWLIAIVPLTAVLIIIFSILRKTRYLIFTAITVAVLLGGFFSSFVRLENYRVCDIDTDDLHYVSGKVIEKSQTDYGEYIIIDGVTADGVKLSGKVYASLSETYCDFCDVGYTVEFYTAINLNELFPYGKLNYRAEDNIKYSCTVAGGMKSEYGFSLFGCIRSAIRSRLYDNLDSDTASICYAMLIGDTSGIDGEAMSSLRYGGVTHIFAVSGLHIGIIYGIISFILKKCRANKYLTFVICLGYIIFYAGICGFTVSSVRAVIMCGITMLARLLYVKRDGLNSLALAVFLILLINPISMFSAGFQLSVCAVGGIMLFSNKIRKLLKKIKIPSKICGAVGTTFGATAGTLPAMMASFGYVSGAGILLNIIIIPLISLLFEFIFVAVMLSTIIPPLGVVLPYVVLPLQAVLSFLLSAGFEKALITGFGAGWFALLYNIAILIISDKLNIKFIPRIIVFILSVAAVAVYITVKTVYPFEGHKIAISASYYGGGVLFKSSQGNVLVVTENYSISRTINMLNENYALSLDGVIILGGDECVDAYDRDLNAKTAYISDEYLPLQPYRDFEFRYENNFELCGINFRFISGHSVFAECDGVSVLICEGKTIPSVNCDLLISQYSNYDVENNIYYANAENTVYFSLKYSAYNILEYGDLSFTALQGNLNFSAPVKH